MTQITKGTLLKFFWGGMFFVPWGIDFCYEIDVCSQGQALRAFFIEMDFSLILSKVQGGFGYNISESFIDRWHMT